MPIPKPVPHSTSSSVSVTTKQLRRDPVGVFRRARRAKQVVVKGPHGKPRFVIVRQLTPLEFD